VILLGLVGSLHVLAREFAPGQRAQPFQHHVHGIARDHLGRGKAHRNHGLDIGHTEQGAVQARKVVDGSQIG